MYLFFCCNYKFYNVIADLRFNKSALSNCSFVKTFFVAKGATEIPLPSVLFSINLWEALQVYQGNHQGVLEETLLERLRSFGEIADGSYFGLRDFKLEILLSRTTLILLQGKQTDQTVQLDFWSSKTGLFLLRIDCWTSHGVRSIIKDFGNFRALVEQTIDLQQAELRWRGSGFLCSFASKKKHNKRIPPPPQQVSKMCFLLGKKCWYRDFHGYICYFLTDLGAG